MRWFTALLVIVLVLLSTGTSDAGFFGFGFFGFRRNNVVVVNNNFGGFRSNAVVVNQRGGFFGGNNVAVVNNSFGPRFVRRPVVVQRSFVQPAFVPVAVDPCCGFAVRSRVLIVD